MPISNPINIPNLKNVGDYDLAEILLFICIRADEKFQVGSGDFRLSIAYLKKLVI